MLPCEGPGEVAPGIAPGRSIGILAACDTGAARAGGHDRCAILRRMNPLCILLAAAVLVVGSGPAVPAEPGDTTVATPMQGYLPDPLDGNGRVADDGSIEFAAGGVMLRLTPLDSEARWRWLRDRVGAPTDPFGEKPGAEPMYLTFLVELRNDTANLVLFNSGRIWLSGGSAEILHPLDLAAMHSAYALHDREMPPSYERAGTALLRSDDMIPSGDRREGLLLFTRFRKDVKGFRMDIPMTLGSGDPIEFTAAWLEENRLRKKLEKHERMEAKRARKEARR